ncbi:MAG TPA: 2-amino-4-hydroxy-6-hydroxymethyldihydropteridine diphosphokinase [Verrucomicrobiae bacterium]
MKNGPWVIVALGSNRGNSRQNVLNAVQRLAAFSDHPPLVSSLWETTPVDCPSGSPAFINAVMAFRPRRAETPESLLVEFQAIEREYGRRPKQVLNEPRPLDLDLIAFGPETRSKPELTIPHPRAHLREFVLGPLNEIAPDLVLPGQELSVKALLERLRSSRSR